MGLALLAPATSCGQVTSSSPSAAASQVLPLEYPIPCIAFSPDSRLLWLDGQLWNLPSAGKGGVLEDFPQGQRDSSHYEMAVSPDGKKLAFHRYDEISLHEVPSGRLIGRLKLGARKNVREMPPALVFSQDSRELITLRNDENLVRIWSLETLQEIRTYPFGPPPEGKTGNSVATCRLSGDGEKLLLHMASSSDAQDCVLLDTASGKELKRTAIGGPDFWVHFSSASADCRTFAYTTGDKLHLMDPASGKPLRQIPLPQHHLFLVALSPDGKMVAVSLRPKETKDKADAIQMWDSATGEPLQRFTGHPDNITKLCFSPDGKTLVSTGMDKTARLWRVAP